MAGKTYTETQNTLEKEQCFDEDFESKILVPYDSNADSTTILSGINVNILMSRSARLSKAYNQMSNEQKVITNGYASFA